MKERKQKTPPKLVFEAHAVSRMKERKIPREVVRHIALYGIPVRTERIANWITQVKRGEFNGKPVHVVVQGHNLIKTAYWADEWRVNVRAKRMKGANRA